MGRATILAGGDAGLYTVRVDYGTAQRDATVDKLTARIAELETMRAGMQITLDAFIALEEAPAEAAVNAAIEEYVTASRAAPPDAAVLKAKLAAHQAALRALFDVRARAALLRIRLQEVTSEKAAAVKSLATWSALTLEEDRPAWCADLTTGATGDVATIDIPGESDVILIAPGAPAPTAVHGALKAREVQTGPQAFFNAAILPGWQKFKPLHRIGTITSINSAANTCAVTLDTAQSSAQALGINQSSSLADVPVLYMTCNSLAFTVGDRVVVEFIGQDWEQPRVIGFETEPRPCKAIYAGAHYLQYTTTEPPVINSYGFTALIDLTTMERRAAWVVDDAPDVNGIVSYNAQPHFEQFGFFSLYDATGGADHHPLSPSASSMCQHGDRFFGIATSAPGQARDIIEFSAGVTLIETGRWAAVPGDGAINSLSAHGGHVAVGGYLGGGNYGVRVFSIASRAMIAEFLLGNSIVESVELSRDYLAVLHWGAGGGHTANLYRRAPYALLNSQALGQYPFSMCITGNKLVGKEQGDVWVWDINPDTGALTYVGALRPFDDLVAARPGTPSSGIEFDGSGIAGHTVAAVAKG